MRRLFGQRPKDLLGETQRKIAELFVDTARDIGGLALDYSEASVAELDGWVDRLWDPNGPTPTENQLDSNTKLIGAYLGEIMIRHGGGWWVWNPEPRQPVVETNGRIAMVLNKVYKRQVNGPADSLADFSAAFRS